ADGRIDLDLHLTIETDDGFRIALSGDGQAAPRNGEPMADLFANIRLSTASREYAWVNQRQIWSVGISNLATGRFTLRHICNEGDISSPTAMTSRDGGR